jgi:hypothetical protein
MAHGAYPPGSTNKTGPILNTTTGYHHGWIEHILPYMEEQNAYNAIDRSVSVYDPKNAAVVANMPRWLNCPSNGRGRGFTCYAACHHDKEKSIDAKDSGVFFLNSAVRYDDITDGSSHTLFVSEKLPDAWDLHWLSGTRATLRNTGVPIDWLNYQNGLPPPGGATQPPPLNSIPAFNDRDVDEGSPGQIGEAASPPPVSADGNTPPDAAAPATANEAPAPLPPPPAPPRLPSLPGNPAFVGGFGGQHPGGVNIVRGDGSISFASRNIARVVWQALANRSDGKLQPNDF